MSYQNFDLAKALKKLQIKRIIKTEEQKLFDTLTNDFYQKRKFSPSKGFQEELAFGLKEYHCTSVHLEAMLNIRLIWPFLREIERTHPKLRIWQEVSVIADVEQELVGEPDYTITKKSDIPEAPYFIIVEAKRNDFEQGWGQALAAMRGAQILNKKEDLPDVSIYGAVSTGVSWQFGKLTGDRFVRFPEGFISIFESENPEIRILALLDIIFEECEKFIE